MRPPRTILNACVLVMPMFFGQMIFSVSLMAQDSPTSGVASAAQPFGPQPADPATLQPNVGGPVPKPAAGEAPLVSRSSVVAIRGADTSPLQTSPDGPIWYRNPWDGFELARQSQRPFMLLFTSAEDVLCQALSAEVFASKSFAEFAKSSLVIGFLDYPRNITSSPDWMRHLKERYKIRGYPNALLFTPKGEVSRQLTGYRKGRPVDYFGELKSAVAPMVNDLTRRKESLKDQGFREWEPPGGISVFAKFEKRNDRFVRLRDAEGGEITVELDQFKDEDRRLLLTFPAVEELHPANGDGVKVGSP